MNRIRFSVLSYFPSIISTDSISVGILFHNLNSNERYFYIMKKWNRLESFDEEVDIEFMKKNLNGMKNQCEMSICNYNLKFDVEEYTKFYANELRFNPIQEMNVEDVEEFILTTEKMYMKYDFEKKERLNRK